MGQTIEINTDNFENEILNAEGVSVVDFGATWCGPCQALAPTIDALAVEYEGRVNIGKCDVDNSQDLASRFAIMSVPTILFFKGGEKVDSLLGNQPKEKLKEKIEALLASSNG